MTAMIPRKRKCCRLRGMGMSSHRALGQDVNEHGPGCAGRARSRFIRTGNIGESPAWPGPVRIPSGSPCPSAMAAAR